MRATLAPVVAALVALAAIAPARAPAVIVPAQAIDGPADAALELGDVAMAEDGSGGVVYRKRVDGRAHVFAARFADGRWHAPQRVDGGQRFDSSWPRIGAGNGGRLVVTWVQEFGPRSDRLFSASLDPGASRFQAPVPIDLNVGEATSSHPSLAMNRGGSAYLSYVVITEAGSSGLPSGYVMAETRLARYNGALWSQLGTPANRNQASPISVPTADSAPEVGIDVSGNGIVAFREPDDEFVDRIWARRIFGSTLGIPLIVSPQQWAGAPLRGAADGFSLDQTGFGQAAVAFRQLPGERSRLGAPRLLVNTIPESFSDSAGSFAGARVADGGGEEGLGATPGAPAVGVNPDGRFLLVYGVGNGSFAVDGADDGIGSRRRLDDGRGAVDGAPVVEQSDSEPAVVAWRSRRGSVVVQERTAAGRTRLRPVAAAGGGDVGELQLAGSGLGDGLVAFQQGQPGASRIVTAIVDAPPLEFTVQTPVRWVRARRVAIGWDHAPFARTLGAVSYSLAHGDEELASRLRRTSFRLRSTALGNGRHKLVVVARDSAGQETESVPAELRIDRRRPQVRVRRTGFRRVTVRVRDGRRRRVSGLRASSTRISFGDGKRVRGRARARHRYRRSGSHRIVVGARDRAGNRTRVVRRVTLP